MGNVVADRSKRWPSGRILFDVEGELAAGSLPYDVGASVGVGGSNQAADVKCVQTLLNRVAASEGGPAPLLAVDGWIGPKTVAAIRAFQTARFGWDDGRVDPGGPTIIELTVDEVDANPGGPRGVVLNAVHSWNRVMAGIIRWVKRTSRDSDYVAIAAGGFNQSRVGKQGGKQTLYVNFARAQRLVSTFGGTVEGVILHEMAHAAGLGHEHQRRDRDRFVRVTQNIDPGRICDFIIPPDPSRCPYTTTCMPVGSYDYTSTMHYFSTQGAITPGLTTLQALDMPAGANRPMGSFQGLGAGDQAALRFLYG